jgi:opacity protein-like surface antigen
MTFIRPLALSALVFAASAGAHAADLGGGPRGGSLKDPPPPPPVTYAEPAFRYYLALRGGWTFPDDTNFNVAGLSVANEYDTGYFIAGAVGVKLGGATGIGGLRGDIEAGYKNADVSAHVLSTGARFSGGAQRGSTDTTYVMASLYYDFDTGSRIRPFIGAGGGIADVNFDSHGTSTTGTLLDSNATAYAYHLTAGLNFELAPGLQLETAYRYFGTAGADLTAIDGTKTSIDTHDHQIMIGLRQSF